MKVSIVVPSYQQGCLVRETLDSLLSQDYGTIEVLVFDGASTDGTVEILESYGDKIQYVSRKDHGRADAINQGLQRASGDILAYLNCGDIYFPGAIGRVIRHFTENPRSLCVYGRAWQLGKDGSKMERIDSEPWSYPHLLETCYFCQPAVFWRREVMERVGVFDDTLHWAMDYDYWLRVGRSIPFDFLEDALLAGSRSQGKARTLSERVQAHEEILDVVMRHSPQPPYPWLLKLARLIVEAEQSKRLSLRTKEEDDKALVIQAALDRADFHGIPVNGELLNTFKEWL